MLVNASPQLAYASAQAGLISCKPAAARLEIFVSLFSIASSLAPAPVRDSASAPIVSSHELRQQRRHYPAPASSDDALIAPARKGLTGTVASDGPK